MGETRESSSGVKGGIEGVCLWAGGLVGLGWDREIWLPSFSLGALCGCRCSKHLCRHESTSTIEGTHLTYPPISQ